MEYIASLSACLCLSLLAFPLSFPPSCPLTRPHLSSSVNGKSVFLQCGFMPEIMEMVENFPVVRGEANSEGSLSLALLPSRHPSLQVCIQVGGREHSRAETRRALRFMFLLPAVCSEAATENTSWRFWKDGRAPSKYSFSSERAAGHQRKALLIEEVPSPRPQHT